MKLTIYQISEYLCDYDERNPGYVDGEMPEPSGCRCDPCVTEQHQLADQLLDLYCRLDYMIESVKTK